MPGEDVTLLSTQVAQNYHLNSTLWAAQRPLQTRHGGGYGDRGDGGVARPRPLAPLLAPHMAVNAPHQQDGQWNQKQQRQQPPQPLLLRGVIVAPRIPRGENRARLVVRGGHDEGIPSSRPSARAALGGSGRLVE